MLYQKEIDDNLLIQFIILYTLSKADSAVAYDNLITLVMDNCNINFGDFQIALDNLVKTNHVSSFIEGAHNQKYEITEKGLNAGDLLITSIPVYIREPIDESIKQLFLESRRKNAVKSDIALVRKNEYSAECSLYDDDKTRLMALSVYAGSREEAEKMASYFRAHSDDIYSRVLDAFSGEN